jgi:long-chain acyl-CoA synthetase
VQGDSLKLVDDIGALRPTMFIGVPRVFDRIYNRVKDQVDQAGGIKKILFNWAFERKKYWLAQGVPQAKVGGVWDGGG